MNVGGANSRVRPNLGCSDCRAPRFRGGRQFLVAPGSTWWRRALLCGAGRYCAVPGVTAATRLWWGWRSGCITVHNVPRKHACCSCYVMPVSSCDRIHVGEERWNAKREVDGSDTWCCFCAFGARGDLSARRVGDLWDHRGSGLAVVDGTTGCSRFVARRRQLVRQTRHRWSIGQGAEGLAHASLRSDRRGKSRCGRRANLSCSWSGHLAFGHLGQWRCRSRRGSITIVAGLRRQS